jgi:hypothetical protein
MAPTFTAGVYDPPDTENGAIGMGGYSFPGDDSGFGDCRSRHEDADIIPVDSH